MIAIITATKYEVSPFIKKLSAQKLITANSIQFVEGNFLNVPLVIAVSGVGIKRSRNCTNTLIQKFKPGIIVSAGFTGALNPKTKVGDLFLPDWVMSRKFNKKIELDTKLPYLAFEYSRGGLLTENSFINARNKKLDLFIECSAEIVDMETWGIAEITLERNVSLISVRAVSDSTGDSLPRMEKIYNSDSKFDFYSSVKYFKNNPAELLSYMKFRFINVRKSRIKLNSFLELLIPVLNEMNS